MQGERRLQSLREVVANQLEQPQLDTFRMLCEAGVSDYDFVRARHNRKRKRGAGSSTSAMEGSKVWEDLEGVRDKLRISGKAAGATACVWADEWAMRVLCKHLELGIVSVFLLVLSLECEKIFS